jgi:two-component system sensor histidine kinase SenX3
VRHTGIRREVEMDLPRGNGGEPLGVALRAVAIGGGMICV